MSATKSQEKSRNFRCGLYEDFLSKRKKPRGGWIPPPPPVLIGKKKGNQMNAAELRDGLLKLCKIMNKCRLEFCTYAYRQIIIFYLHQNYFSQKNQSIDSSVCLFPIRNRGRRSSDINDFLLCCSCYIYSLLAMSIFYHLRKTLCKSFIHEVLESSFSIKSELEPGFLCYICYVFRTFNNHICIRQ